MANTRKVIHATCVVHPGTPGFCNLEAIWDGEYLTLSPHVTGAYTLVLGREQTGELHEFLGEVLR